MTAMPELPLPLRTISDAMLAATQFPVELKMLREFDSLGGFLLGVSK